MQADDLKSGDIVAGLEPDEHVEVRRVAPFRGKTLIEGVTVTTRREIRRPLGPEELAQLKGERPRLHIIQNPGAKLTAEMLYKQVQWLVDEANWQAFAEEPPDL